MPTEHSSVRGLYLSSIADSLPESVGHDVDGNEPWRELLQGNARQDGVRHRPYAEPTTSSECGGALHPRRNEQQQSLTETLAGDLWNEMKKWQSREWIQRVTGGGKLLPIVDYPMFKPKFV